MKKENLFPPEIIEFTTEEHFSENNKSFSLIYIGLIVAIVTAFLLLPVIKITVSTQARDIVRSVSENVNVLTSIYGQVRYSNITEGKSISKGDTLLVLRSDRIDEQIRHNSFQKAENHEYINDLNHLIVGDYNLVNSPRFRQEMSQYKAKLDELDVSFQLIEKEFLLAKHLFDEKVTAEMEYVQAKNQYELFYSQIELFQKQAKNNWMSEQTSLIRENTHIESTILQLEEEKTQYVLTAPDSGTLSQTLGIQSNSFVSPGVILGQISPDDDIIVECYISPKDIGFIFPGQSVRIQVDAFNYNQWGLIYGEVMHVSEDIILDGNNPVFRVRCSIFEDHLLLKSGHKGYLKKGMTLTGRFDLTRRSLFQLLFDKVDNWLNPKLKNS
ncbi:HlyD family secretion protein [Natronoflexus pectinivorans]|uniref:HlyD family secretion protein n=1 Tax=Natronoflexus pectinivorans TaxID=682526 RepID=A0A4V2RWG9_9BACT|nr:HlyD family efflux transporter periplasmic adaptor subunit [Natronoflexus pectinivorans]TCO08346.1 HlyD family secretion protein [Natronoflexus pectinivorans]